MWHMWPPSNPGMAAVSLLGDGWWQVHGTVGVPVPFLDTSKGNQRFPILNEVIPVEKTMQMIYIISI